MLEIEMTSNTRSVNTPKGSFTVQEGYAHLSNHKYPVRIEVMPPRGQAPYAPGKYKLAPDSFYVDGYNKLGVHPKLIPLA